MIHIKRPPLLDKDLIDRAAAATSLLVSQEAKYAADRPKIDQTLLAAFEPHTRATFNSKCAFCESPITKTDSTAFVKHFRPVTDALERTGGSSRLHYYWLAYDWANLYVICATCDRNKGTNFPVRGTRAPLRSTTAEQSETALLLDPCGSGIDPLEYLDFTLDGSVSPRPLSPIAAGVYGAEHPGAVTIEVLGLNRSELVAARAGHAVSVMPTLTALKPQGAAALDGFLAQLDPTSSYQAVSASLVRMLKQQIGAPVTPGATVEAVVPAKKKRRTGPRKPVKAVKAVRKSETPIARAMCVTKVTIENFYAIDSLEFDMSSEQQTWKVFLGENATGKTTVLKAIALALMGERFARDRYAADSGNWLRRQGSKKAASGSITVQMSTPLQLSSSDDKLRITFGAGGIKYRGNPDGAPTCVRGYGAVRLPGTSRGAPGGTPVQPKNATNLWDPAHRLPNVHQLLTHLPSEQRKPARLLIADLLSVNASAITIGNDTFHIELHDTRISVDELSAGYADVLNIAVDLLTNIPSNIGDMRNAFGVVLVDELGAHLHPRWKMKIVTNLKNVFPLVQFIATTHDPLCLRDLDAPEIVVMERTGPLVRPVFDLPAPRAMRVDQLLTSRFFGLGSTIDPRLDKEFQRYYELLAKQHRDDAEQDEYEDLKSRLDRSNALGFTRRDQLLYELIDKFLADELRARRDRAQEPGAEPPLSALLPEDFQERVRAEWRRLAAPETTP